MIPFISLKFLQKLICIKKRRFHLSSQKEINSYWFFNFQEAKKNILPGFIVFLIALPLSIGISVASGAPPTAGLLSAIIGGVFASFVSGSYVTISGPAAGLIVVILDAVTSLGGEDLNIGFRRALAAIVIAGLLQIILGLIKAGRYAGYVPTHVLQGMLSSIGIIIIVKQIFVLEGLSPKAHSILLQIIEIPSRITENNLEIFLIGVVCLSVVIVVNLFPKINKVVPAPLFAIIIGYFTSLAVDLAHPHEVELFSQHFEIGPKYLLKVPVNLSEYFISPLFDRFLTTEFLIAVIAITLVGSIESVLSTAAVDKIDKQHRESDLNMDLISKGLCNSLLGLIGGLPIISEIVRSSANINSGATERWSNLFHGLFIAVFIVFATGFLNQIPLATFAAILIFVGFKLANPIQIKNIVKTSLSASIVFFGTVLTVLGTDLLVGILVGILLNFILNLMKTKSLKNQFLLKMSSNLDKNILNINLHSECLFTNSLKLKDVLESSLVPNININFNNHYVDASTQEMVQVVKHKLSLRSINLVFKNIHLSKATGGH